MAPVLLASGSAVLFGAMTPVIRLALAREGDAALGAAVMAAVALVFVVAAAAVETAFRDPGLAELWPFAVAGLVAPGGSNLLFTAAVRAAGPSRTSVVVGTAPVFAVAIALVALDEPLRAPLLGGAAAIVLGGCALARERSRPEHVRAAGLGLALGATILFAGRDDVLRWLALDTDAAPFAAGAATLVGGAAVPACYVVLVRGARGLPRRAARAARAFAPAGLLWGVSYLCLFEAYFRGRVSIVSPLVATESLFGVAFSVLVFRGREGVGRHLVLGAGLIVAGGALIGAFR